MSRDVTNTDPAGTQLVQPSPPDARTVLRQFEKVTLVGAGTLGISWAALFLGHGLQVYVNDPRPDIEDRVTDGLRQLTPTLDTLGLDTR